MTPDSVREPGGNLDRLLSDLVRNVPAIAHAVLLSTDGLLLGASSGIDRSEAERLSAVASGFSSLAKGAARLCGRGAAIRTVVEMEAGLLCVCAAGGHACLAALALAGADTGAVACEMALLVRRLGHSMAVGARGGPAPRTGTMV